MRAVQRPAIDSGEAFARCISGVRNKDLKKRFESITQRIKEASACYATRAQRTELHLLATSEDVSGLVTKDEMSDLYNNRMAHRGSPGRLLYDELRRLPDGGICPFCDQGSVSTLDHVLPKSAFPTFAVTPDNLVGACRDCNAAKSVSMPTGPAQTPLHPYFENISGESWLGARVVTGQVAAVVFHVTYVPVWSNDLNARIQNQFDVLGLGRTYAIQAAREISGQREILNVIYKATGRQGVRKELLNKATGWKAHNPNCWQAAAFRVLSQSEWYCAGGFKEKSAS